MARKSKILMLVLLSCFLGLNISAQEASNENSNNSDAQEYMLDEVIVTGDSSLVSLRMEVYRAEEYKFEIFNSLNSTDEFDITCEWRAPLGSNIKRRFCDAGYIKEARAEDARQFMDNMTEGSIEFLHRSDEQLVRGFAHKAKALNKEMIALAIKHPELATAMIRSHELNRLFQEEKRARYKDSLLRYLAGKPEIIENKIVMNEIDMWEKVFIDHSEGKIQDNIWARWDNWCKTKLQKKHYQKKWESANQDKYVDEFKSYINAIISGN